LTFEDDEGEHTETEVSHEVEEYLREGEEVNASEAESS